ncbi:hypothetical protein BDFB_014214 [Asbolus verrucosus]|uniref:Uncharacterized protein n=1 Tax=Asbolus verrucosus TaxID=1661398 RepID=A0A482VMM9_ASBVE|nr:hypothetical protein BDFB_014214 [Asbolus verrucosus]
MPVAQNEGFVFDFKRVMFIMQFLELHVSVASNNYNEASAKCSVQKLMNVFVSNISKGHFEDFLKFCNFGQLYWSLMGSKIPCCKEDKNNEAIAFANELMLLKLLPNFYFILKYCRIAIPDLEVLLIDELRDDFIQKILKTGYERTCRICYVWRDYLTMQVDLFDISLKSLLYTIHSRKYFSKERAVLAFQALIYTLKDFTFIIKEDPAKIEIFINQVSYFSSLFDVLAILIEEFSITWKDSFEAIDVIAVSFDFLSLPNWPAQVVVKTLKLINIAIAKYMSPNLALLVDSATDSTVALLGPLLYLKLRDDEPKVKETALDVVCTISRMSNISK